MNAYQAYQKQISEKLSLAFGQEKEILQAAAWLAKCLANQGWIYSAGTGHSHLLTEEIFYRAGGFARIRPILIPALMLHENASKSTDLERIEGFAGELLSSYELGPSDVFILISNSGRNAVPLEMAQIARDAGAKVICITNLKHSKSVNSRHSTGLKLYQVCDLVLDNFGEIGDASIALEGLTTKVGATSTVVGAALIQAMMVQAASILAEKGLQPEIFSSSNSDQGEVQNQVLTEKYKALVKEI